MEVIVKVNKTKSPWINAYCPNCKQLLQRKDIMNREVKYCHLCGTKIEFSDYLKRLKESDD